MLNTDIYTNDNESLHPSSAQIKIPVIEETATIGKQTVETGTIKVIKSVTEKDESFDVNLLNDQYFIEHVAMNKIYDEAPQTRQEGETLIVPVVKEVLVKKIMLVEEIRITKKVEERTEQHQVTLRSEAITVTRSAPNELL